MSPSSERVRLRGLVSRRLARLGFTPVVSNGGTSYQRYRRADVCLTVLLHDHTQTEHGVTLIREGTAGAARVQLSARDTKERLGSVAAELVA